MSQDDRSRMSSLYDAMMQSEAWQDLEKYIEAECDLSMRRIDNIPAENLVSNQVCQERGIREGMRKVLLHAGYRRDGA